MYLTIMFSTCTSSRDRQNFSYTLNTHYQLSNTWNYPTFPDCSVFMAHLDTTTGLNLIIILWVCVICATTDSMLSYVSAGTNSPSYQTVWQPTSPWVSSVTHRRPLHSANTITVTWITWLTALAMWTVSTCWQPRFRTVFLHASALQQVL